MRSLHWNCKDRNHSTSPIRKRCQKSRCENLLAIWRTVILKTQKEAIMQHFKRKPVFGGAFEVGYPRKWELSDDDMDHYYWGIVNLICKTPNALKNEEVEALI